MFNTGIGKVLKYSLVVLIIAVIGLKFFNINIGVPKMELQGDTVAEIIYDFFFNHFYGWFMIGAIILSIIGMVMLFVMRKQREKDPNSVAYLFKKYDLETKEKTWKVLNDPKVSKEDKKKISMLWDLSNQLDKADQK